MDEWLNYGRKSFSFIGLPFSKYLPSVFSQAWNRSCSNLKRYGLCVVQ